MLGRMARWRRGAVELEADEKHARLIRAGLGILPRSNRVVSPAVRTEGDEDGGVENLGREGATKYRLVAARANAAASSGPTSNTP